MKKNRVVIADRNIWATPWYFCGLILTPLSVFLMWAGHAWEEPGFIKLSPIAGVLGLLFLFYRRTVLIDRESRTIEIKTGVMFASITRNYPLANYRSIGYGWGEYGGTDGPESLMGGQSLILCGKKGKAEDLVLYETVYPAIRGHWLHRMESERFKQMTERAVKYIQLPQEKYGP